MLLRAGNQLIDFTEFISLMAVRIQHRHSGQEVLEAFQVLLSSIVLVLIPSSNRPYARARTAV